ncbi:tRNA-i(6)A37 methylthiotransferase, partial [hydrothermal vent metagenome]
MPSLSFHIETFGCQMNDRDSEIMAQLLAEFCRPAPGLFDADIVMINTCSIRQKAEQKAFSLLGTLKQLKSRRPEMIIGVAGCVAQQEGDKLLARLPYVDLVLGTQNIYKLPELISKIKSKSG